MRICHGLLGEVVEVEDQELQWRKPIDIVRQHARERWEVDTDDIIVLAGGGGVVGPGFGAEEVGLGCDMFLFLKSALDPQAGCSDTAAAAMYSAVAAEEEEGEEETVAEEEEEADAAAAEVLHIAGLRAADDPAFETFRCNIAEARRRLAEVRPVVGLATRLEAKLEVQQLGIQAVLDNLTSHRTTCNRSMSLFLQKYQRVQERLDHNLGKVEASMTALVAVPLHPALRASGRESLADALPRERILRFTAGLQAERARLAQRLEKLKQQDARAQALCDQAATKVHELLQDDTVKVCAAGIRRQHAQVIEELLPALEVRLPVHGADSSFVLEEEKRTAGVMEGLAKLCREIRDKLDELRSCWERRLGNFLQRLREVSYIQSKVRGVERQAALLEEEINVQHNHSQQLNHLQKMPKAYQKALSEVGRRREFRARYVAQGEQARNTLARMMEDENTRRRGFAHRFGYHLPADLVRALGAESAMVPPAVVEVPDFDSQLPDLGTVGSPSQAAASASAAVEASAGAVTAASASVRHGGEPIEGNAAASAAAASTAARGSSTSSCSSSLRSAGVLAASSARGAGGGAGSGGGGASGSGSAGPSGSSGGSQVQVRSVEELEARNHALQEKVESLLTELATQRRQQQQQQQEEDSAQAAPPMLDLLETDRGEPEIPRSGAQGSEA